MEITGELDRKIRVAQAIMEQLDGNQPLSSVLSQVRLLANITGDLVKVALIDIWTHGLLNVPYQEIPFTDPAYRDAVLRHMKLCSMEDTTKLDIDEIVDKMMKKPRLETIPVRNQIVILSVYEMENLAPPPPVTPLTSKELLNLIFQRERSNERIKSILMSLRGYIYDYASGIWLESVREQDRIKLLGPDYRLITNKLDTLETPVGGELLAALDNLSSNNPANWNACALICRNVVLKLGTILWKVPGQTYVTRSGETRDVSIDKEKNRLCAYIDAYSKKETPDKKELFDEAQRLVKSIYNKGSKGKKQIRHNEVKTLVVDTFHLIDLLNEVTELKHIDTLP